MESMGGITLRSMRDQLRTWSLSKKPSIDLTYIIILKCIKYKSKNGEFEMNLKHRQGIINIEN